MKFLFNLNDPKVLKDLNFNRYALMAMGMTAQSCLASIAVYEILKNIAHEDITIPLSILAPIAMASNAIALAQAPIKLYVQSLIVSGLVSTALLIYVYFIY